MTFSNGSDWDSTDKQLGVETSLALRVLYNYFVDDKKISWNKFQINAIDGGCSNLKLYQVLECIKLDNPNACVIYLGIDEFTKLLGNDNVHQKGMLYTFQEI